MRRFLLSVTVMGVCAAGIGAAFADDHQIIEAVMKNYHKGKASVASRAMKGEATADEIAKLAEAYKKMLAAKPPRGDEADWKQRVEALVAATDLLVKGDAAGPETFKTAVNCKACHTVHKPE